MDFKLSLLKLSEEVDEDDDDEEEGVAVTIVRTRILINRDECSMRINYEVMFVIPILT